MMSANDISRPDPEELLRRIELEEAACKRGRLKVFLGYAPRVGKSLRMFEEGVRRKKRGQDVVVGAVQERGAEEIAPCLRELEVIPLRIRNGCTEMDLEALVARRPAVCLVDELAHRNTSACRFAERWQEVTFLLSEGINVVTAVNLQHIAEQQDRIEQITGRRATDSVPESFVRSAEEIVVVDASAQDLVEPSENDPELAERACRLSQLRELALILAADVIETKLQKYMDRYGIQKAWGTQERVLVCVTPRSNARAMIESGSRNAERSHGQLLALYVEQPNLNRAMEETLNENMDLARKCGAEVHVVQADDPVVGILDFARSHRITQLFIGHTQRSRLLPWRKSPVDRLIEEAEGMDVRIFPQQ